MAKSNKPNKPKRKYTGRSSPALNPSSPALLQPPPPVDNLKVTIEPAPVPAQYARQLGSAYLAKVNDLLMRLRYLGLNQEAEAVAAIVHDLQDVLAQR